MSTAEGSLAPNNQQIKDQINELLMYIDKNFDERHEKCECFKWESSENKIHSLFKMIEKLETVNKYFNLSPCKRGEVVRALMLKFSKEYICKTREKKGDIDASSESNPGTESRGSTPILQSRTKLTKNS